MTTEFIVFLVVQAIVDVVLLAAAVFCVLRLKTYRRMVQLMTAASEKVETDPALLDEWAAKRSNLPEGSPKWHAYTNRLEAEGYFKQS